MKHKDGKAREVYLLRLLNENKFAIETACNLCCTNYHMYTEEYWQRIKPLFICYVYENTSTLAKWTNIIMRFVKMPMQEDDLTEVEKFFYWFVHITYKSEHNQEYEEVRKRVKREYLAKENKLNV